MPRGSVVAFYCTEIPMWHKECSTGPSPRRSVGTYIIFTISPLCSPSLAMSNCCCSRSPIHPKAYTAVQLPVTARQYLGQKKSSCPTVRAHYQNYMYLGSTTVCFTFCCLLQRASTARTVVSRFVLPVLTSLFFSLRFTAPTPTPRLRMV